VRLDSVCRGTRHARTDRNANTRPTSFGWGLPVIVPESGSWDTDGAALEPEYRSAGRTRRAGLGRQRQNPEFDSLVAASNLRPHSSRARAEFLCRDVAVALEVSVLA